MTNVEKIINVSTNEIKQGYNRRFEGNGLGLALVKSYCDMNMATIKVKTVKNFGTTFTIKFEKPA